MRCPMCQKEGADRYADQGVCYCHNCRTPVKLEKSE